MQQTLQAVTNNAHEKLGQVNTVDGRLEEASSHFAEAMKVAKNKGDQANEEKSSVLLGVARGMLDFQQKEALLTGNMNHGL